MNQVLDYPESDSVIGTFQFSFSGHNFFINCLRSMKECSSSMLEITARCISSMPSCGLILMCAEPHSHELVLLRYYGRCPGQPASKIPFNSGSALEEVLPFLTSPDIWAAVGLQDGLVLCQYSSPSRCASFVHHTCHQFFMQKRPAVFTSFPDAMK